MKDARRIEEVGGKQRGADEGMVCRREGEGGFGGDVGYGRIRGFTTEKGCTGNGCSAHYVQHRLIEKMSAYFPLHRQQERLFHRTSKPEIITAQLKHLFLNTMMAQPTRPKATKTLTPSRTDHHGR